MASDLGGQMWRATAGRRAGKPAASAADALQALLDAGVSKKDIASQLGVTPRTVERWTTTTGAQRRDPSKSKSADDLVKLGSTHPSVRAKAMSKYRRSRMRNRGGQVRINGNQGPTPGGKSYLRKRMIVHEIDGRSLDKIVQAWESGNDDDARDALREALEDQGYPDWTWDDEAVVDFLGHPRD